MPTRLNETHAVDVTTQPDARSRRIDEMHRQRNAVWYFFQLLQMSNALIPTLQILGGFVLLTVGGDLLVKGASRIAAAFSISPLVIGLTIVAFGTSAPELAVSIHAALAGSVDVAIGNVVGSNIFNILFTLGLSAMIVPLVVSSELVRRDVPLMVASAVALFLLGYDGQLGRVDGALLFVSIVAYTVSCIWHSRRESRREMAELAELGQSPETEDFQWRAFAISVGLIAAGLALLSLGSDWLVDGAVWVAQRMGVSELVIGLTIVAVGTSLPEVVTSVVASLRGERDMAVGNVVGSNLFNILCVLGCTGLLAPEGVTVSATALRYDIPIMILVSIACWPVFATGRQIARWEGSVFFLYYLLYTTLIVMEASGSAWAQPLQKLIVFVVAPATVIALAVSGYRSRFKPRNED